MTKYSLCMNLLIVLFTVTSIPEAQNIPSLLFSTGKDIRITNSTRLNNNKIKATILVRNLTDVPPLDYHYEKKKIYYGDHSLESIQYLNYSGSDVEIKVETVISGVMSPEGLACDWFTNKIYWADSDVKRIEVATTEGLYRKVLFWTDIDQPRAILLIPMKGFMFWTDWGDYPKIERAGMNGDPATRTVVVSTDIFWPNGLTVDYDAERVYWVDGRLQFIDSMDYNGKNRTRILSSKLEYPFALTMFHNKLFWTDWKTWSVHYYDKNSRETKELMHLPDLTPMDIHVYDKKRQPKRNNSCELANGGCSHLCLLAPYEPGYSCGCPIGIKLIDNLTCASGPQELLLVARRTDICLIYLDSPEYTYNVLPLNDLIYTIAVDFDPVEGFIYWTDDEVKKIQRARLNGTDQHDIITNDIQHPDGIAIDWISRNVYWTDTGTDRVEMARLNPVFRRVIISDNLHEPRAITVAPELGWLFWSDWGNPKIERANLDGSERQIIVQKDIGWPNGLTLDLENGKIYWGDARTDRIEYSNMDGTDRRELINDNVPHVFGFSLMGDFLYWTDWQRRAVERAHKESGNQRKVIVEQMANVMGLKAIKLQPVIGKNPCWNNNGNCSQLCFYRHNKTSICACQLGYELSEDDRKTCVKAETFLLFTKEQSIGRVGIENKNNQMIIPVSGIKHLSAIDFDYNTQRIYWSDSKSKTIMRAYVNGSEPEPVIDLGLILPKGIAVDWLGLNIYWTDPAAHRIEVSRFLGSSRRTLLWGEVYEPHSIVLDPPFGQMYWSEWGSSNSIKKASMDGSHSKKFISTSRPASDLTLDFDKRRLYWSEIDIESILSSDLNGNDKRTIVKNDFRPIGLTLFNEYIYWANERNGDIIRANKYDGSEQMKIDQLNGNITDMAFYYSKQENININHYQCAVGNGGCSHLCLTLSTNLQEHESDSYTCACPTHYILIENKCIPPKQFMIYSQKNLIVRLLPDTSDCPEAVLPIQGLKNVRAIDFDPLHNYLYWIEGKENKSIIKRADTINGLQMSVVIQGNFELQPFDLVVDSIGRLLFWTCAAQNVINVTQLDNNISFGIVVQREYEKPRLLAIHLPKRLLFYTDIGSTPQLIRTRLDGSHRIVIVKAENIAAIAVDAENDLIVWAQGQNIYISNIDGENQHVLINESNSRITQLTVHSGWLYWIDKELNQLQRLELISGKSRSTLSVQASNIIDIISITKLNRNHSCITQLHHKKCSHLCIMNGTNPMCACPKGNMLKEDKRTCSTLLDCGIDHFTCRDLSVDDKDCIPISWRCDHQEDCADGSDEFDCPNCQTDQFRCTDGQCININYVCDGIDNCQDKSDETKCCKDGFQCANTQVCLPMTFVCDKIDHCADGSDEQPSYCATKLQEKTENLLYYIIIGIVICAICLFIFYSLYKRVIKNDEIHQSEDWMPMQPNHHIKTNSETSYDRSHITGASSSTNGSSFTCYPRETLNPPPSPATTAASTRGSSPSSRYRPYRHYRTINQPPPPTPCSTDVCDESDYNYPTITTSRINKYDGGHFPPPPTPRSHCHSESCPPSPSSRSSTYFSPLPPPPSPVTG